MTTSPRATGRRWTPGAVHPGRPETEQHPPRRPGGQARRHHALRRQRAGRRIHDQPGQVLHNNVANGLKLLDAAVECGVKKFVFSSTCATYGPPDRLPMTEDLPQRPINPYGESKLMFEKMLQWYQRIYGLEFIAFRYFNAAGASEKFGEHHRIESHLIPNVLQVALGRKPQCEILRRYPTPDGTCIRDYIHIVDLAQARIHGPGAGPGGLLQSRQLRRLFRAPGDSVCEKMTGRPSPPFEKPRRPGHPPHPVASADKNAARELMEHPITPASKTSSPPPGPGIADTPTATRQLQIFERTAQTCGCPA